VYKMGLVFHHGMKGSVVYLLIVSDWAKPDDLCVLRHGNNALIFKCWFPILSMVVAPQEDGDWQWIRYFEYL
jgi:hypothetical protein